MNKYIQLFRESCAKIEEDNAATKHHARKKLEEMPTATKQFVDMEYGEDYPEEEYEYEIDQNLVKKLNGILEELDLIASGPYGNGIGPNFTRRENDFNHDARVAAGICHDSISELFEKYGIKVSDKVKGPQRYGLADKFFNDDYWLWKHRND
jgi:hypothetical protein